MNKININIATRRKNRIRAKLHGTKDKPRFSFTKTNQHLYGQLINDDIGETIVSTSSLKMDSKLNQKEKAFEIGKLIAQKAKENKIERVVFDRGGSTYTGIVKECAESARKEGLKF